MSATPPNGKSSITLALMILGMLGAIVMTLLSANSQFSEVRSEQATSKAERLEIKNDRERLTNAVIVMKEDVASLKAALTEIETQFRATENYINLMRADQLRTNSLLWKEAFGSSYPDAAFYPSISRGK